VSSTAYTKVMKTFLCRDASFMERFMIDLIFLMLQIEARINQALSFSYILENLFFIFYVLLVL